MSSLRRLLRLSSYTETACFLVALKDLGDTRTSELSVVVDPCEATALGRPRVLARAPRWRHLEGKGSRVHPGT